MIRRFALAVVTWDDAKKQYRFQSWRMPGGVMVDTEDGQRWDRFHEMRLRRVP